MVGWEKTSMNTAIKRGLQCLCFRSRTETALVVSLALSGHHHQRPRGRKTILLSSLTSPDTDPSQLIRERVQSHAGNHGDQHFAESYQHTINHLMLIEHAGHGQIGLVTESLWIVRR